MGQYELHTMKRKTTTKLQHVIIQHAQTKGAVPDTSVERSGTTHACNPVETDALMFPSCVNTSEETGARCILLKLLLWRGYDTSPIRLSKITYCLGVLRGSAPSPDPIPALH